MAHQDCEPCDSLPAAFARQLRYDLNRNERRPQELYQALALSVKEQLLDDWCASRSQDALYQRKQVAYLSLEFLMGRSLGNALLNLDLTDECREMLQGYAVALETLQQQEHDAGLGNGGLGRLAACFMDSCASLGLAVTGTAQCDSAFLRSCAEPCRPRWSSAQGLGGYPGCTGGCL
ncbi:MAG: hypothetical protein Sw2LagTSB_37940 [Shewanella algae]